MDAPHFTKPTHSYGTDPGSWAGRGFTVKNEESADNPPDDAPAAAG